MMQVRQLGWRAGKGLLKLSALLLGLATLFVITIEAATGVNEPSPAWATPSAMALKRVSDVTSAQHEPNFLSNLDCSLLTYRLVASSTTQTGCFSETAFGLFDSDSQMAIFNGTDEGLPLFGYSSQQALVPWPGALDLVALQPVSTGGTYLSLYRNPLAGLRDQRNLLGQLTAKQLVVPPDLPLRDSSGQALVVNPQSLAFSDGGSWLVVENLTGSFVRINLATLDMVAFAPAYAPLGSPGLQQSRVAISRDGRYVAITNDSAGEFKVYDLTTCQADGAVNLQPQHCAAYDYESFVRQQISGLQGIRHVRFVNDGLLSFEAQTSTSSSGGIYELAPAGSISSLIDYLGLGDSYTSGEGAFDYLASTDTGDNSCHLSARSYPLLLTHDLFGALGGHSVACSGAEINDVGNTSDSYRGQVRGVVDVNSVMTNFLPGYVAQQRFVGQYQPGVTTVSVGGDDIGFGDILERCVEPKLSPHLSDATCFNTYEDRLEVMQLIDRTGPRWTALYKQLVAKAPSTRLYAIGYPQIVADTGDCALNVHLGKSELEFALELTNYLNAAMQQAATKADVTYVDISQALAGHRLCEIASYDVAVNGLTAGKDTGPLSTKIFGKESYHPNALGQALIEQAILKQTHNLTNGTATGAASNGGASLLNAPKSGRVVNTVVPDNTLTTGVAQRGTSLAVTASGSRDGLPAQTAFSIRLDGSTGLVIGTTTTNTGGDLNTAVTVPTNTAPGGHTIDVTGTNQAGEPVDVTQPIYVPSSNADSDGDGITDTSDSCPGAANSGVDSDQDGIDDSCDPLIGSPPTGNGSGTSSPSSGSSNPTSSSDASGLVGNSSPEPSTNPINTTGSGDSSSQSLTMTTPASQILTTSILVNQAAAQVLGTATINPTTVPVKNFKPSTAATTTSRSGRLPPLRVIHWLPWVTLPIFAWWLLIITGYCLKRLTKMQGFRLQ